MSKAQWAEFTFPPLNLWNMQKHSEIVKLINEYYYEHYKQLWEEGQKELEAVAFLKTAVRPEPFGIVK